MKWHVVVRSLAALALVLGSARASAQVTTTTGTGTTGTTTTGGSTGVAGVTGFAFGTNIQKVTVGPPNGEKTEVEAESNVWLKKKDCESNFDVEFTSLATRVPFMELWVSLDPNTDCSASTARAVSTAGTTTTCWKAAVAPQLQGKNAKFTEIPGRRIFDQARKNSDFSKDLEGTTCPDLSAYDTPYYLWFVPLNSETLANSTSPAAPMFAAYRIRFNLFTLDPATPSGIKTGSGENAIKVSWDGSSDQKARYRAFFELRPDGDCATGAFYSVGEDGAATLKRGDDVAVDNTSVWVSGTLNKTSSSLTGMDDKNIPLNSTISVAVAGEDLAGNIGKLSTPQCVKRIETISAIDACGGSPSECGLETCGLSPASRGSWFGLSLFVLFLAALIRRRTA